MTCENERMSLQASRTVHVAGVYNLRDIGGYRAGDQRTKWRTVFRSDAPVGLTGAARVHLRELGIRRVIDLRDDSEARLAPNSLREEFTVIQHPIFQGVDDTLRDPNPSLEAFYAYLVTHHGDRYVGAIREVLAAQDHAVLVHCTAGKDRTGTLVAFMLTSVGVDSDDILHDYAVTESHLAGEWADQQLRMIAAAGIIITPELRRLLVASPAEALAVTLKDLNDRFGSVPDYLRQHGLTDAELESLGQHLLTPADSSDD